MVRQSRREWFPEKLWNCRMAILFGHGELISHSPTAIVVKMEQMERCNGQHGNEEPK